jgi:hypothetical protein
MKAHGEEEEQEDVAGLLTKWANYEETLTERKERKGKERIQCHKSQRTTWTWDSSP